MPEKDVVWNSHCDILEEYWRLFETCNCPARTVCVLPGGREVNIGKWLDNQRQMKRGTRGQLHQTTEREARLQALVDEGKLIWDMSVHDDARWDVMYNLLVDYGTRNGTCNVPQREKSSVLPDGSSVNLGLWVYHQRQSKDTTMKSERRARLQTLVDQGLFKWNMTT